MQLHTQEQHYKNVLVKTVQRTFERGTVEYRKDIKWKYNFSKNAINRKEIITHNYYLIASYTIELQIIYFI